jgi:transcriptional regulator with XRE-family HTH domain
MAKPGPGPLDLNVGARIRLRRKALGITQSELAQALGLTFQQVQKYERGVNRVSASVLVKIAQRLECPVSYLLGEEGGGQHEQIAPSVMVTPGAVELLEIYARIKDRRARAALLSVAKALVCQEEAECAGEADAA